MPISRARAAALAPLLALAAAAGACSEPSGPDDETVPVLQLAAVGPHVGSDVSVSGTASDEGVVERITYLVNGGPENEVQITPGVEVAFTVQAALTGGTRRLEVRAYDAAGNVASAFRDLVVDPQAPTLTLRSGPDYSYFPERTVLTQEATLRVAGRAADESGLDRIAVQVNGTETVLAAANAASSLDFEGNVPLVPGTNEVRVIAYDRAGNRATINGVAVRFVNGPVVVVDSVRLLATSFGTVGRRVRVWGRARDTDNVVRVFGDSVGSATSDAAITPGTDVPFVVHAWLRTTGGGMTYEEFTATVRALDAAGKVGWVDIRRSISLVVSAVADSATTTAGTPVYVNVTQNDYCQDDGVRGAKLTVDNVHQPENGRLTVEPKRVLYTPAPGFTGTDRFVYLVRHRWCNGGPVWTWGAATVTVTP